MATSSASIPDEYEGSRLDKTLEFLQPEAGLRQRRRMCDEGQVLVDGVPRQSSFKVAGGQLLEVRRPEAVVTVAGSIGVHVLKEQDGLAAVFKPDGIHTAAIAGRENVSVESLLPELFPGRNALLLNRLDNPTSGIVLAALTSEAEDAYRRADESGAIIKEYYARVHGRLMRSQVVRNTLDTAERKKTRVLPAPNPDERRWTHVEPVECGMESETTLVRCLIKKGARHQIRAHLAALGHPILGDSLYGSTAEDRLHLHHHKISLEGFEAISAPPF